MYIVIVHKSPRFFNQSWSEDMLYFFDVLLNKGSPAPTPTFVCSREVHSNRPKIDFLLDMLFT